MIAKKNFLNEIELILLCTRPKINDEVQEEIHINRLRSLNWDFIFYQSRRHRIIPLIYSYIKKIDNAHWIPSKILINFQREYYASTYISLVLWNELKQISEILKKNNLQFIPFRGVVFSEEFYFNLGLRPTSDIDILIHRVDYNKFISLITDFGYREHSLKGYYIIRNYPIIFYKIKNGVPIYIDLFQEHFFSGFGLFNERKISESIWGKTRKVQLWEQNLILLSLEDTFLHTVVKIKDFQTKLRYICDASRLLQFYKQFDWEYLSDMARQSYLKTACYFTLKLTRDLLKIYIPNQVIDKFTPNAVSITFINSCIDEKRCLFLHKKVSSVSKYIILYILIILEKLKDVLIYILSMSYDEFKSDAFLKRDSFRLKFIYYIRVIYIPFVKLIEILRVRIK